MPTLDIEDFPEIDDDCTAYGNNGQDTINFGSPRERHKCATSEDPKPPVVGEITKEVSAFCGK